MARWCTYLWARTTWTAVWLSSVFLLRSSAKAAWRAIIFLYHMGSGELAVITSGSTSSGCSPRRSKWRCV